MDTEERNDNVEREAAAAAPLQNEENDGLTVRDQVNRLVITFDDIGEVLEADGENAKDIVKLFLDARKITRQEENHLSIGAHHAKSGTFGLDKVNSTIWTSHFWKKHKDDIHGEELRLKAEPSGKPKASIILSIDFDELSKSYPEIDKKLDDYDRRVYIAVDALYQAGNEYMSINMIHRTMGKESAPCSTDREQILNSLRKMMVPIKIENQEELDKGYTRVDMNYVGSLLPHEIVSEDIFINGQQVSGKSVIHLLRDPPLSHFARERGQVTTIDVTIFQSPGKNTKKKWAVEHYLIEAESKARTGHRSSTITFEKIFEKANVETRDQKSRCIAMTKKILDFHVTRGVIRGYTISNDKIILKL